MQNHELYARLSLTKVNIPGSYESSRFRYHIKLEADNKGNAETLPTRELRH